MFPSSLRYRPRRQDLLNTNNTVYDYESVRVVFDSVMSLQKCGRWCFRRAMYNRTGLDGTGGKS
jgi:hypothetical protein